MERFLSTVAVSVFLISACFVSGKFNPAFTRQDSIKKSIAQADTTSFVIPDGLTAEKIIENYINAIGGRTKLSKVLDRTTVMKSRVNNKYVTITIYQKVPDKMRQVVDLGTFKQNVYFNGKEGVMVVAGKTIDVKGSELEKLKYESMLHFLIELDSLNIKLFLEGATSVHGKKAYQIMMVLPSGAKWIQYYDSQTWLKVKETKDIVTHQGTFIQDTYYSDYKDVDGIKYPFLIEQNIGSQHIEFEVQSIKVNSRLSDDLFKQN